MSFLTRPAGLYPNVPNEEYHRGLQTDPRPLSSTLAKNLLRKLPADAKWELENGEYKDSYDFGTAVHELILEGELKTVIEIHHDSYRSTAAKEERDDARFNGLTPMLSHRLDEARAMADAVRSDPEVMKLLGTGGDAEISALCEIEGVPVQTRYDYLRLPGDGYRGYMLDLKTSAESAAPRDFMRNGAVYGYHIQAALYRMALAELGFPDLPFFWLVVSTKKPYAHSIIQASEADLKTGEDMAYTALDKWADIIKNGWPTNTPIIQSSFPTWTKYEIEDIDA